MTPRRTLLRPVAMVASAMVVLSGCGSIYEVPLPGGADVGKNPITVHVEFRDVLDLVPQSTVKVDDVTVGKVKAIDLKGYTADVTLSLPRNIDVPDNARAEIRQTSLLGEKFVSLEAPETNPSPNRLGNGDVIPLSRSSRNPEVEEVLGALSLLLNGGGVGQLKTIAAELNTTLGGREDEVRSVLDQLRAFMGQLADNKEQIVRSIDSLNRLALSLKKQDGSIKLALDDLPAALKSINGQRKDLVRTLQALSKLSGIGVKVIKASKEATINSLRDLSPVLDKLADAGQDLPNSLQVFLTYPFVDEAVGRDPQVARNLHMGDFTNLSVRLDLNLTQLPALPSLPVPSQISDACKKIKAQAAKRITASVNQTLNSVPLLTKAQKNRVRNKVLPGLLAAINCKDPLNGLATVPKVVLEAVRTLFPKLTLPSLPGVTLPPVGGLGLPGLGRAGTSIDSGKPDIFNGPAGGVDQLGYNSTLGSLLLQGVNG